MKTSKKTTQSEILKMLKEQVKKYKVEMKSYGETCFVFETGEFTKAQKIYRTYSKCTDCVILLFLDDEKCDWDKANQLMDVSANFFEDFY